MKLFLFTFLFSLAGFAQILSDNDIYVTSEGHVLFNEGTADDRRWYSQVVDSKTKVYKIDRETADIRTIGVLYGPQRPKDLSNFTMVFSIQQKPIPETLTLHKPTTRSEVVRFDGSGKPESHTRCLKEGAACRTIDKEMCKSFYRATGAKNFEELLTMTAKCNDMKTYTRLSVSDESHALALKALEEKTKLKFEKENEMKSHASSELNLTKVAIDCNDLFWQGQVEVLYPPEKPSSTTPRKSVPISR
jgi:hypothetical protein